MCVGYQLQGVYNRLDQCAMAGINRDVACPYRR